MILWSATIAHHLQSTTVLRYHLKDVIIGKIYYLLVRIKLKNMDLEIRRRESTGSGANTHVETETLAKFELMDGAPVREVVSDSAGASCVPETCRRSRRQLVHHVVSPTKMANNIFEKNESTMVMKNELMN